MCQYHSQDREHFYSEMEVVAVGIYDSDCYDSIPRDLIWQGDQNPLEFFELALHP